MPNKTDEVSTTLSIILFIRQVKIFNDGYIIKIFQMQYNQNSIKRQFPKRKLQITTQLAHYLFRGDTKNVVLYLPQK